MLHPSASSHIRPRARPRWRARAAARALSGAAPLAALLLALPGVAHAHTGVGGIGGGFVAGFSHPLRGVDHVLAMLAVGMWGAQLGAPALWLLPVAFPLMMSIGGVAGIVGVPFPPVEIGIALSVIVLGAVIALDRRPPLAIATLLVAFFAVFHGYAHGQELPGQAGAVAYCAGFVLATGLIHLTGITIGFVTHLPKGLQVLRLGGSLIAVAGLYLAWQVVSA